MCDVVIILEQQRPSNNKCTVCVYTVHTHMFLSRQTSLAASSHRISTDRTTGRSRFPFFHSYIRKNLDPGGPGQTQMDPDRLKLISFAVLLNI